MTALQRLTAIGVSTLFTACASIAPDQMDELRNKAILEAKLAQGNARGRPVDPIDKVPLPSAPNWFERAIGGQDCLILTTERGIKEDGEVKKIVETRGVTCLQYGTKKLDNGPWPYPGQGKPHRPSDAELKGAQPR